ncbi:hypothetical protein QVD17_00858 [Tagetes erecta]|uniref:Uncharacterized protein n=1 Tax=Tagetes erecta TaxID=13708 RepID=A0AAD8L8N8_TARER|nr:hypothetical protein QVD17_00858 [Tagetes erecta]
MEKEIRLSKRFIPFSLTIIPTSDPIQIHHNESVFSDATVSVEHLCLRSSLDPVQPFSIVNATVAIALIDKEIAKFFNDVERDIAFDIKNN